MTKQKPKNPETAAPKSTPPVRKPYIPEPPSRAEIEELSRDQALITDEWAGDTQEPPKR